MTPVLPPYGDLWKVARVDTSADPVTPQQCAELFAWLAGLDVPYRDCRPELVITENSEGGRLLMHLTRYELDCDGNKYIDHAAHRTHTTPLVVEISDYPAWLVQASNLQDQTERR